MSPARILQQASPRGRPARVGDPFRCPAARAGRTTARGALLAAVLVSGTALSPDVCQATNPIVAENALPGDPPSDWDIEGAGDPSIQGFATDMSVNHGETIGFKVNTPAADYRIDIYRLGYYGGMGARHVATVQPSAALPQAQPPCLTDAATHLVDCGTWAESASWAVPADAVSGIYVAKLVREDPEDGRASHTVFVVRDDERGSALLFQTSDTTWQAYNKFQEYSLYSWVRAYKVSYNRPVLLRGAGPWDWVFNAEYPMLRWLERNGYDVSYTTDVDSDRRGAEILEHQIFLSVGHDEYWSRGQREAVRAARDAGVHLAFCSGNEVYWKTRWEPSIDGSATPYRTLVCYKESHNGAKIDPLPDVWTGWWRDCRFSPPADGCEPENALSGQISWTTAICDSLTCGIQVPATYARMRLWRDTDITSLAPGQVATFPAGTLGHEWDYEQYEDSYPPGRVWLSSTTVAGLAHHLSLYRAPSGALVFGAGTIQWAWGLDDHHTRSRLEPIQGGPPDARMQQATVNVLAEMGAQPGTLQPDLTAAAPSGDLTPPVSHLDWPAAGDTLVAGPVVIRGDAADDRGVVGAVEVSVDGGATWKRAAGLETWSYAWSAPANSGPYTIRCRAADDLANLEIPGSGATVWVGGPPLEILSVGAADSVYVNGVDVARITVTTRSNWTTQENLRLHVWVASNRGDSYEVGRESFALGARAQRASEFSWPVAAAGHPWEFSVTADLTQAGSAVQTRTRASAFAATPLSRADVQRAEDLLAGASGCLDPQSTCTAGAVRVVPFYGTFDVFTRARPALCRTRTEFEAGRLLHAGASGIAALHDALDGVLESLLRGGTVPERVPSALREAMACHATWIAQGLGGSAAQPRSAAAARPAGAGSAAAGDGLDSLAGVVRSVFADAGRHDADQLFVRGPAQLRVGRAGRWTSRDDLEMRDADVFDVGTTTGIVWGRIGPHPRLIAPVQGARRGRREGAIPEASADAHAAFDFEIRGTGSGSIDVGILHRTARDSILWLRYEPIAVTANTVLRATLADSLTYPWGFGLFLDRQNDGNLDDILYPGGSVPSATVQPAGLRFALLPSQPNPFNPSTLVRYVLPEPGPVRVTLHDIRGRLVRELFRGTQGPGLQQIRWDGKSGEGRKLPSGIYLLRVRTRWGSAAHKLVLVQ